MLDGKRCMGASCPCLFFLNTLYALFSSILGNGSISIVSLDEA